MGNNISSEDSELLNQYKNQIFQQGQTIQQQQFQIHKLIQSLENEYLNANCSNSQDKILIRIDTGIWEISGFLNYE